jgi:hypothetical protein
MGLDFSDIPDRQGAALYIIHTDDSISLERFTRLAEEIRSHDNYQVILVNAQSVNGEKICSFYSLSREQLPAALIIADDDSVPHQWFGENIPTSANDIVYYLQQLSA